MIEDVQRAPTLAQGHDCEARRRYRSADFRQQHGAELRRANPSARQPAFGQSNADVLSQVARSASASCGS